MRMQGHFYGDKAQELGGTFNNINVLANGNNIVGSFGAKKQEK